MEGDAFGKYRLLAPLGRGGMGEVWRAFDTETDRTVALKVLPAHSADDETYQTRFRREARAAAGLSEPHVVPIHGYGEIEGRLYVDMRLIVGRDLEAVLREGALHPARAVMIIEQVASALHAAHQIGLVHRDVKPSNILLAEDDFAYLIDFGIAKAVGETGLTNTGTTIGTWAYMAPERFTTTAEANSSADVYALACVLYHCLTGQMPYPGTGIEHFYHGHVYGEIPKATTKNAEIPAALDTVIATGMAKNPDERYATTKELAQAARAALTRTREPIPHPTPVIAAAPETPPAQSQPQEAIPGSSSLATSDTGAESSSVDAVPEDSGAEMVPSHPAPEVAIDPAADTRTAARPSVSASDAPRQQAPVSAGKDRLAPGDAFGHAHTQGSEDRGVLTRYSPRAQAAISAALLIPTMVLYFGWFESLNIEKTWEAVPDMAGLVALQGLYFIVVVAVVTRIQSRKPLAVLVAVFAVVLDTLTLWLIGGVGPRMVIHLLMIFVYAVAWGIACRQHRRWVIGLAAGVVVGFAYLGFVGWLWVATYAQAWFFLWAMNVGSFAIVCLICWAFDVAGRRRDLTSLRDAGGS